MKIENDIDLIAIPKQEIQAKINKELKYIGSMNHRAGHTLFEINLNTFHIKPAAIEHKVSIGFDGKAIHQSRVQVNKECYYLEALNLKNAVKRFKRIAKL